MSKIHYATGGLITPERSEFSTLCNRKFSKGTNDIMQSGYIGAKNVACKDCRKILDRRAKERNRVEEIKDLVQSRQFDKLQII